MYMTFYEYPTYSSIISEIKKNVNENIQCVHSYAYYSGKQKICTWVSAKITGMTKTCFPDAKQVKKCLKTVLCNECTNIQKDINESDKNFDSPPKNEPNFSSLFFMKDL